MVQCVCLKEVINHDSIFQNVTHIKANEKKIYFLHMKESKSKFISKKAYLKFFYPEDKIVIIC